MNYANVAYWIAVTWLVVSAALLIGWDWFALRSGGNPNTDTISDAFRVINVQTGYLLILLVMAVVIHVAAFKSCWKS